MNVTPLLPIAFMLTFVIGAQAQNQNDPTSSAVVDIKKNKPSVDKGYGSNMFKVNLSAILFKGVGVQYERKIGKRTTIALGFSTIPSSTLAFKSFYENQINNDRVDINDFKIGTTIFTPELKYYFGKAGAFHGFYIAPYMRIGHYKIEGPVRYNLSANDQRVAVFSGSIKTISGGLLLGSNFRLSKNIYLDWWIIGGSFGSASGSVSAISPITQDEQDGLKKELDRTKIPLTTLESEVNANGATVTSKGAVIGLRGLGLNLGIRF